MSTLRDWFETVAFALNDNEPDHEFTRYPLKQMVAAYNSGMCLVYKYRPDLFTEWEVIKLQTGRYQDTRGCCDNILDIPEQVTEDGGTIKPITGVRKSSTRSARNNWKKPSCLTPRVREYADEGYIVENARIDSNMDGRFIVDPPVPPEVEAYVRVKCVRGPCPVNEADMNASFNGACDMATAVWHYVLARMLSGDRFAQGTTNTMEYHYSMFFNILGVVRQQEDRIESPEEAKP